MDTWKTRPRSNSFSTSGKAISASHFEMDCLLTLQAAASSSCVIPYAFRN